MWHHEVGALRFTLVACYDGPVPASGRRSQHRDAVACAWFIRAGEARVRWRGGSLVARRGQGVLIQAHVLRDQDFTSDAAIISLRLLCQHRDGGPVFLPMPPTAMPGAWLDQARDHLGACAQTLAQEAAPDDDAQSIASAFAQQRAWLAAAETWWRMALAAGWQRAAPVIADRRFTHALTRLLAHDRITAVPWDRLCADTSLSRRQLDRLFHRHAGMPVATWLDRHGRERAMALLADPALPIKAIASRLGFSDASHFTRWFRLHCNRTPRQERQHASAS